MEKRPKDTIFFYGIPAYGHTLSNLYLAGRLAEAGFRVVYYSAEPFRREIRENGCEYRPYPIDWKELDLRDGERILKLYRLILQYTWEMLPGLLRQAKRERPRAVLFESLALWGRAVGELLALPTFAFYSIAAIDWTWGRPGGRRTCGLLPVSPWEKGLGAYTFGFCSGFFRYAGELPGAVSCVRRLRGKYGLKKLGLLPVLMNRGDYNLCGYSRLFQPGGRLFGESYKFLGPLSVHRRIGEENDFTCPKSLSGELCIYISLGTIFNGNETLLREIVRQFGEGFRVILVWQGKRRFPENFIVRPFVNQNAVLQNVDLFITAGGVNSIHEALYFGVPCLLCPQQGEQGLNARQFERLGFGRVLRNPSRLRQEALACAALRQGWNEKKRAAMTAVSLEEVLGILKDLREPQGSPGEICRENKDKQNGVRRYGKTTGDRKERG